MNWFDATQNTQLPEKDLNIYTLKDVISKISGENGLVSKRYKKKKKLLPFRKKAWIPIPYLTPKQIPERLVLMVKT